jgi:hypothetical protein
MMNPPIKNMHNFNKNVEQSMDEIILRSGLCRKANSYDLDQLKRVIRKELRQNWYPADWLPKKD